MKKLNRMSILIVEDEVEIRQILVETLKDVDAHIHQAKDGIEALEFIQNNAVDLVLSDINMPRMDGLELLEHTSRDFPELFTIVITALGDKEIILNALKLHAYDFFEKPIDNQVVITKVKNILDVIMNRKLLKLTLKEWMVQKFSNLEMASFEQKSINEQNELLKAALEIFKLKSMSQNSKASRDVG